MIPRLDSRGDILTPLLLRVMSAARYGVPRRTFHRLLRYTLNYRDVIGLEDPFG